MEKDKVQKVVIVAIVVTAIIVISLTAYLANMSKKRTEFAEKLTEYNGTQNVENIESASTGIGKNVEKASEDYNVVNVEVKDVEENTTNTVTSTNTVNPTNTISPTTKSVENNNTKTKTTTEKSKKSNTSNTVSTNSKSVDEKNKKEETEVKKDKKEVKFSAPIKGEILRDFAQDSLVYSETLQEWVIHNGVDIKADKTSVVSSVASGTVYAIKNDPRYGLTVIINHDDGYKTVYSNLLTAEFVVEGEKVKEGQSIGTVGNTASFETADEAHLHFELMKNNKYINPTTCIEF